MKKYSKEIANQISNYLTEDGWRFSFNEEKGIFEFHLTIGDGIKAVKYFIDVKEKEYLVYAMSPLSVSPSDKKAMTEMAEFTCRVNYGLKQCNFEFDMDDGDIFVKSYVDCEGRLPTEEIIKNSLCCPAMVYKTYGEGIIGIIFREERAEAAIENCERRQNREDQETPPRAEADQRDMEQMLSRLAVKFGQTENKQAKGDGE